MTMGDRARNFAWYALDAGGAFQLAYHLGRHRLTAVTYHHVLPDGLRSPSRSEKEIYVSEFEEHVGYLARRHHVIDGAQLRACLGGAPLPPHAVLITFDDGYRNNYRYALPVLRRFGVGAIFFLTSGFVGQRANRLWYDRLDSALAANPQAAARWLSEADALPTAARTPAGLRLFVKRLPPSRRDAIVAEIERATGHVGAAGMPPDRCEPMTWDEVREMAQHGMAIGAHTATHQILAAAQDELGVELAQSRATIEAQLDRECWCFSYPNGEAEDFGQQEVSALRAAGFLCAFTQIPGLIGPGSDPFALPRMPVPSSPQLRIFRSRVSGLHRLLTVPLKTGAW
jgi:peptidoglycan/xylan/chitin deacetylase (PgdA/CDA1 family)